MLSYLEQAPLVPASEGREVQIGGPDILSYGEMLDRMAEVLGRRRRPKLPGAAADPAAVLAVDRPGHAGGRRRRAAAGRGTLHADGRHRPRPAWRSTLARPFAETLRQARSDGERLRQRRAPEEESVSVVGD